MDIERDIGDQLRHERDQHSHHPRQKQEQRAEHRHHLGHEGQGRLVDLCHRLEDADEEPDYQAQTQHRSRDQQRRLDRLPSDFGHHLRSHV